MKVEVRISGQGGQGIILASIILAEAAGIYDGKYVIQSQVYGAAARGEISKADVIISDEEIFFPEVLHPDVLVALSEESFKAYSKALLPTGIVVIDSFYVRNYENREGLFVFPFFEISMRITGKRISANIASLGAISGLTSCVELSSLERAMKNRFDSDMYQKNIEVLRESYNLGLKAKELSYGGKNG